MSKQKTCQRFIFKLHSTRLRNNKWKLTLPLTEARRNEEIISLADSQMLRWIDELNGVYDADERAKEIKSRIRSLKREDNCIQNRREIKKLYEQLDSIQFKPDYLELIIDKEKDYYRAVKGFSVNGVSYVRLLGTNGGIKNSTIVFVSERLAPELRRRIDNGRDMTVPMVPAKLEAYKALTCSASIPVSWPKGVLIVKDLTTTFRDDFIYLNDECDGEPEMRDCFNEVVELNATDGCGMMLPSLAARWSEELELGYTMCGCNTRNSWTKGMLFAFDFVEFAEKVAGSYIVKDYWGNDVDVRDVEVIFTDNMMKLCGAYGSCEEYLNNCMENGYNIGIPKVCPEHLENERSLNYQFIQPYDLNDDDIEELIAPTMNEIKEVLGGDWRKTILFLKGRGLDENNVVKLEDDFVKALMIDQRLINDPFVQDSIYQLIHNRINEAKVGVLKVHGNFSMVAGDLYALAQHIFGLEVTGLLKPGEIYNKYWIDSGAEKLSCFRAPMSNANNIRRVFPSRSEEAAYWFRYINTGTIFNAWDTACAALNGCDFDGDLVMLTDNNVLVNKLKVLPAINCVQRKAEKIIPTEEDVIRSNVASFGNDIGKVTNRTTSMYELQSHYSRESEEYKVLDYRIKCGQLIQQNVIDKAKGIIAKPMPKTWYDKHSLGQIEDDEKRSFYRSIIADRKPYFMRYIYPDLMRQYNTYIRNTSRSCLREFRITIDELKAMPYEELSDKQKEFLRFYDMKMPVGMGNCVMNRIRRRFEEEFDSIMKRKTLIAGFDYKILGSDVEYTRSQKKTLTALYEEYIASAKSFLVFASYERVDQDEANSSLNDIKSEFIKRSLEVCSNSKVLCNILLDVCYSKKSSKRFVWDICSEDIIQNLLSRKSNHISFPTKDPNGRFEYCGEKFRIQTVTIGGTDGDSIE